MNPCAMFGMTLAQGAEYMAATLVMVKFINALGVASVWSVIGVADMTIGLDDIRLGGLKTLEEKMTFICAESCAAILIEYFLLVGIWRKNPGLLYTWMWLRAIHSGRIAWMARPQPLKTTLFEIGIQLYQYWIVSSYGDELESEVDAGRLIVYPIPIYTHIVSLILSGYQIYVLVYDPIVSLPDFSILPFLDTP